jgi:hypothetical protein
MAFSDVFSEQEDEIQDQIRGIAAAALACVERRCLVNNFPEAAVDLIALHRYFALLGLNPPVSLQEQLDRCLRFRVEIESEIGFRRNQLFTTGSYRVVVAGEQDTGPPDILAGYIPLGDLTLRYTETTGGLSSAAPSPLCSGTIAETISSTTPGTMRLQLDPLVIQETKGSYATRIVLEGGDPQSVGAGPFETYTDDWSGATCTSGVPDASHLPDNWWAKIFSYAHRDERTGGDPYPIAIARFHRGTNPIFLQKQYVREADLPDGFGGVLAHYYEATTIRIRHVPIPAP